MTPKNIKNFQRFMHIQNDIDFYYKIATEVVRIEDLETYFANLETDSVSWVSRLNFFSKRKKNSDNLSEIIHKKMHQNPEMFLLGKDLDNLKYSIAPCCNPIPGDDVIGFVKDDKTILIHRTNCDKATKLMTTYGKGIVKAKWREQGDVEFLTGIRIEGIDAVGIVADITNTISADLNINIRSINIEASDGVFFGEAMIYVHDAAHVDKLISKLRKVNNIRKVLRIK